MIKLEMICTGEEVLSGQIVDTNAAWFSNLLMEKGVETSHRITVGDRLEDLVEAFQYRSQHADVILVNGGLGPTTDDLSAEAMAMAKGEPLVECAEWRERLEGWMQQYGRMMSTNNMKQAMLPESAVMVDNPVGTACGFRVKLNRAWLFFTPGVPHEFKKMTHEQFLPFLQEEFGVAENVTLKKLLTIGHGESRLGDQIERLRMPEGITIGYRSSLPYNEIKIFARGAEATEAVPDIVDLVRHTLGDAVVAEDKPSLPAEIHSLMQNSGQTLSLAESCTGGLLASQLVDFAGSSAYLQQALVTYCNESKMKLLQVSEATLEEHGAVSLQTVREMAQGVKNILGSDYALSTSGIAGPDGGSEEKPVGTVAIGLSTPLGEWCQILQMPGRSRGAIRSLACAAAYDMLRRALLGQDPIVEYPSMRRTDIWVR